MKNINMLSFLLIVALGGITITVFADGTSVNTVTPFSLIVNNSTGSTPIPSQTLTFSYSNATHIQQNSTINNNFPIDTTDYFGQASKIFNDTQMISAEEDSLQQQITNLKASNTANNATINAQITSLQNQLDVDSNHISYDFTEIKRLETLNIKSYQVDQQTKNKLLDAQNAIRDKYNVSAFGMYSDNPVQLVYADFKYRTIVVLLDPAQVTGTPESLAAKVLEPNGTTIMMPLDANTLQSLEPTKDVPVDIQYGKITPLSCTSGTQICTPLVGGVSISNIAVHTLNTIGYRAFSGQQAGFVIAGHTATESNTIVQPYNSNNVIGTVTLKGGSGCDCAFVPVNQATQSNIFINGVTQWAITADIPASQQVLGTFVYKSGAGTGVSMGQITGQPAPGGDVAIAQMNVGPGDSGSPVVQDATAGTTAHLDGQLYSSCGVNCAVYNTWDLVQSSSELGVTPALQPAYITTLLGVYNARPDLKSAFPEVTGGNYDNLLNWAGTYGITTDPAYTTLQPYAAVYELMAVYSGRPDLQAAFPEAVNGANLVNLLNWAGTYGITTDPAHTTLQSHAAFYTLMSVYETRPDLQAAFPEAVNGANLANLLNWAGTYGITTDPAHTTLQPYAATYVLMSVYAGRPDLQAAFPEADNTGKLTNIYAWAEGVATGATNDPAHTRLQPYATQYTSPPPFP